MSADTVRDEPPTPSALLREWLDQHGGDLDQLARFGGEMTVGVEFGRLRMTIERQYAVVGRPMQTAVSWPPALERR